MLPGPFPKFYAMGGPAATAGTLAADLQNAMNAATCTGSARANVYSVTYDPATGRFGFLRSTASRPFRIRWDRTPNNIRNALAETSTAVPGFSTGTINTDAPWILLYRTTGAGSSGTGLGNLQWTFTETIAGTATNFFQLRAGRLWNGEVIRVNTSGEVCGMDFPLPATKTNPASIRVAAADATCNPTGDSAIFDWGGGSFTGNDVSCNGFRSKSQLIPCDLQMGDPPLAPLQYTTISPYIADELPLDANGNPQDWNGDAVVDYQEAQDGSWRTTTINVAPSAKAAADADRQLADRHQGHRERCRQHLRPQRRAALPRARPQQRRRDDRRVPRAELHQDVEHRQQHRPLGGGSRGPACDQEPHQPQGEDDRHLRDGRRRHLRHASRLDRQRLVRGRARGENEARRAAFYAEELFRRIDPLEPASSVQTYMVGSAVRSPRPTRTS